MRVQLKKSIKPGYRRKLTLTPDEAVDVLDSGAFAVGAVVEGDSSAPTISPDSSQKEIVIYVNGDGALGDKVVSVQVDAHVGPDVTPLVVEIGYTVAHKDATTVEVAEAPESQDELIPADDEEEGDEEDEETPPPAPSRKSRG